jgi:hypothetical protein
MGEAAPTNSASRELREAAFGGGFFFASRRERFRRVRSVSVSTLMAFLCLFVSDFFLFVFLQGSEDSSGRVLEQVPIFNYRLLLLHVVRT